MVSRTINRASVVLISFFGLFSGLLHNKAEGVRFQDVKAHFTFPLEMYNSLGFPRKYADELYTLPELMYIAVIALFVALCVVIGFVILRPAFRQTKGANPVLYSGTIPKYERICCSLYSVALGLGVTATILTAIGAIMFRSVNNTAQQTVLSPTAQYVNRLNNGFHDLTGVLDRKFDLIVDEFIQNTDTDAIMSAMQRLALMAVLQTGLLSTKDTTIIDPTNPKQEVQNSITQSALKKFGNILKKLQGLPMNSSEGVHKLEISSTIADDEYDVHLITMSEEDCKALSTADEFIECIRASILASDPSMFITAFLNMPYIKRGLLSLLGETQSITKSLKDIVEPLDNLFEPDNMESTLLELGLSTNSGVTTSILASVLADYPVLFMVLTIFMGILGILPLTCLLYLRKANEKYGGCGCRNAVRIVAVVGLALIVTALLLLSLYHIGSVEVGMILDSYMLNTDENNKRIISPEMNAVFRGLLYKDSLLHLVGLDDVEKAQVGWMAVDIYSFLSDVVKTYNGDVLSCQINSSHSFESHDNSSPTENNDSAEVEYEKSMIKLTRFDKFINDTLNKYTLDDLATYVCREFNELCPNSSANNLWTIEDLIEIIADKLNDNYMQLDKRSNTISSRADATSEAVGYLNQFWSTLPDAVIETLSLFSSGTLLDNPSADSSSFDCVPFTPVVLGINNTISAASKPSIVLTVGLCLGFLSCSICIITAFFGVPVYHQSYLREYKGTCKCGHQKTSTVEASIMNETDPRWHENLITNNN